jgi:hypothetical protein
LTEPLSEFENTRLLARWKIDARRRSPGLMRGALKELAERFDCFGEKRFVSQSEQTGLVQSPAAVDALLKRLDPLLKRLIRGVAVKGAA